MLIAKVDKIIELRKAHGLNQKRLSEKAGLPVNAVFRIETGAYTRTQDLRAKIARNTQFCCQLCHPLPNFATSRSTVSRSRSAAEK